MEFVEVYFYMNGKFLQQKDGMAMDNVLSPIVSNIFMSILRN
jgi:hypothetical protein